MERKIMMNDLSWLLEDINLNEILFPKFNTTDYVGHRDYYEHSGGHTVYVKEEDPVYSCCNYSCCNYSCCNYSCYSCYTCCSEYICCQYIPDPCLSACQVCNTTQSQCAINQYVSAYIGKFSFTNNAKILTT